MDKKPNILKLLELVTPTIPAPIYWENVDSVLLGGNDAVIKGTGAMRHDAYVGKSLYELYPKDMAEHIKIHNEEVMRTGKTLAQEEAIEDITTGEFKYFTAIKAPLYDDDGKIIGIVGTSIDITDRKLMEEDLKKAKETAELALQAMKKAQAEERKQREEAERLAIENAAHKAELEIQEKFITVVNRIAHDVAGSMGVIKKMTKYFSNLKEITSISGYEMRPISASEREDNIIYIQADDNGLQYEVLDSQKELKKGVASWEQLFAQLKQDASKVESDFLEFQKEYLPILLEYTEKLGFTKKKMIERRIPEAQRVQLENSTQKAMTIMEGILSKYLNPEENQDESISVFPPSLAIHDAFAETRLNYSPYARAH